MNDLQRAIVTRLISDAVLDGYSLEVFNGEDIMIRNSRHEREIFAALESTEEDQLRFRRAGKRVGFVRLVYKNIDRSFASEYSPILEPVMAGSRDVSLGILTR